MGKEKLNGVSQNTISLIASQGLYYSPHSTAKTNIKAHFSGRIVSSGISDVVFFSTLLETLSEEIDNVNYYFKKSQEITDFSGHQKLTSTMKLRL